MPPTPCSAGGRQSTALWEGTEWCERFEVTGPEDRTQRKTGTMVIGRLRHWLDTGEASRLQPVGHRVLSCLDMSVRSAVTRWTGPKVRVWGRTPGLQFDHPNGFVAAMYLGRLHSTTRRRSTETQSATVMI
jgi:hypothetical protein